MAVSETDVWHLRRCVELAREALEAGDEPFGSVLVGVDGTMLAEERNREISAGDATRHPEIDLARWSARHLSATERSGATVYTSGEHCPMCSAAHAWVGLGRIVFAVSSQQRNAWLAEWGAATASPVQSLSIASIAPAVPVDGPAVQLADDMRQLHHARLDRSG